MSEFFGMRRIFISLPHYAATLPKELEPFHLYPTETEGVYDTPYTPLDSPEWNNLEQVLTLLEHRGSCKNWKIVGIH